MMKTPRKKKTSRAVDDETSIQRLFVGDEQIYAREFERFFSEHKARANKIMWIAVHD